mgnify:FL=1|tara:strand:- start:601 stop:798 length:198 start_codon:yes stop_codon:yes gene_type:complete
MRVQEEILKIEEPTREEKIDQLIKCLEIIEYENDLEVLARQMNEFEKKGLKKFNEELLNSFTYNK